MAVLQKIREPKVTAEQHREVCNYDSPNVDCA
jgi:hypothetical protein